MTDSKKRWIVRGITFFVCMLAYVTLMSLCFPVDENNELQIPEWCMYLGMLISTVIAFIFPLLLKKKQDRYDVPVVPHDSTNSQTAIIPEEDSPEENQSKMSMAEAENALLKAKLAVALAEKENLERAVKQELEDKMTVAKAELLTIDLMDGHDFENWCAEALRNSGFANVSVTPGSGDQGVDITAEKDGLKYAVQCKRYSSDLGNTPVQEVFAGQRIYNCHVGVVLTNRDFTAGAKDAAAATGVLLWGRSWVLGYLYRKYGAMPEAGDVV